MLIACCVFATFALVRRQMLGLSHFWKMSESRDFKAPKAKRRSQKPGCLFGSEITSVQYKASQKVVYGRAKRSASKQALI